MADKVPNTEPGDVVLDIFAGSNTRGQVAEAERRRWLAFERSREYVLASVFRFLSKMTSRSEMRRVLDRVEAGETIDLNRYAGRSDSLGSRARGGRSR